MNPPRDPLVAEELLAEELLAEVAIAGAEYFVEVHMKLASPAACQEVRRTVVNLISASVLVYLERVARTAESN